MQEIRILGPGCPNCAALAANAEAAARDIGLECAVRKVTDINEIISAGVMMTPALMVDGQVKCAGKVASVEEIKQMLNHQLCIFTPTHSTNLSYFLVISRASFRAPDCRL